MKSTPSIGGFFFNNEKSASVLRSGAAGLNVHVHVHIILCTCNNTKKDVLIIVRVLTLHVPLYGTIYYTMYMYMYIYVNLQIAYVCNHLL
jgi:hypothetical protein